MKATGSTTHTLRPKSYYTSSSVSQTYIHSIRILTPNKFCLYLSKLNRSLTLREPELFMGRDPKKLKSFLFQCKLYFWNLSETFRDNSTKVNFTLSYLQDVAQEWFEPGISGELDDIPDWIDNWDLVVDELQTNFGPFDQVGDIKCELVNLHMKNDQQISEYLVQFNSLSSKCQWGEPALRHHFYNGLPPQLKDDITKGDGKPWTLSKLQQKARNADAQYWEHVQEHTQEQASRQPQQKSQQQLVTSSSSSS